MAYLRNVSTRLTPTELIKLEALRTHHQELDERPVSLGEAARRAILSEHDRVMRRRKREEETEA